MECNHSYSHHTHPYKVAVSTSAFKTKKCNLILFIKIHQMILRDKIIIFSTHRKSNRKFIQNRKVKKERKVLAFAIKKNELIVPLGSIHIYIWKIVLPFVWLKFQLYNLSFFYRIIVSTFQCIEIFFSFSNKKKSWFNKVKCNSFSWAFFFSHLKM